jgi:hypothetical protein
MILEFGRGTGSNPNFKSRLQPEGHMAELEIHHEGGHGEDPLGKKVGVLAATFAVALAVVTILSHRAHTEGVMAKAEENDEWGYYQAERLKAHNAELGHTILSVLAGKNEVAEKELSKFEEKKKGYEEKSKEIQEKAKHLQEKVEHVEKKALYFDLGEGLLEIALVMSSLYFIAKKKLFPTIGVLAGLGGAVAAIYGGII